MLTRRGGPAALFPAPALALALGAALALGVDAALPGAALAAGTAAPAQPGVNTSLVKVDTVGFTPLARKLAVVNLPDGYLRPASPANNAYDFSIVEVTASGQARPGGPAWSAGAGDLAFKGKDPASGDECWQVDFTGLTLCGRYIARLTKVADLCRDPRVDCVKLPPPLPSLKDLGVDARFLASSPFDIAPTAYARALVAAQKMFYYQRDRTALKEPCTLWGPDDDDYTRATAPHTYGDVGWLLDAYPKKTARWPVQKGWFDAGNLDIYVPSEAPSAQTLLLAYDLAPQAFGDANGIPESGNGIPDILDEAAWGLDWVAAMQTPEGSFRAREAVMTLGEVPEGPADLDRTTRWVSGIGSASTAKACAALALAARVFRPFDAARAAAYARGAQNAWAWLQAHPDKVALANPRGCDQPLWDDGADQPAEAGCRAAAAFEMWHSFKLAAALEDLRARWGDPQLGSEGLGGGWPNIGRFAVLGVALDPEAPEGMRAEARRRLFAAVDPLRDRVDKDGYRCALRTDEYYWGSPCVLLEKASLLALAARLDPEGHAWAREAALDQWHWVLGRNANAYSLVSRVGFGPTRIYHSEWGKKRVPPPGYLVDGPNYGSAPFLAPGMPAKALLWFSPTDLASGAKAGDPWHNDQQDLWQGGFLRQDQWGVGWWVVSEVDVYYNANLVLAGALSAL